MRASNDVPSLDSWAKKSLRSMSAEWASAARLSELAARTGASPWSERIALTCEITARSVPPSRGLAPAGSAVTARTVSTTKMQRVFHMGT